MARCEVCGNDYDKAFLITLDDQTHTFDSFECAIHALAPVCGHCDCRVIGHGVERHGVIYCCTHCAEQTGRHHESAEHDDPASGHEHLAADLHGRTTE